MLKTIQFLLIAMLLTSCLTKEMETTYFNGALKERFQYILSDNDKVVKNGKYAMYHIDGSQASSGQYVNNKRTGLWYSWGEDGVSRHEFFTENDLLNGEYKVYYKDMLVEQMYYKNDTLNGEYKEFNSDGSNTMLSKLTYVNGKIEGSFKSFHFNGALAFEANYINDKMDGLVREYSESGDLTSEYTIKNDRIISFTGKWKVNDSYTVEYKENGVAIVEMDGRKKRYEYAAYLNSLSMGFQSYEILYLNEQGYKIRKVHFNGEVEEYKAVRI